MLLSGKFLFGIITIEYRTFEWVVLFGMLLASRNCTVIFVVTDTTVYMNDMNDKLS